MTAPNDFRQAYGRFLAPIRAKCRRLLGRSAVADDVAQEAFARLWHSGPALDGKTETRTIMAWLYLTSTRLAMDVLRERRRSVVDIETEPLACNATPDAVVGARRAVIALCDRVPPDEIEAALLARVDGLSQPEVAQVLGVSERTVRRLLERFDEHSADLKKELA